MKRDWLWDRNVSLAEVKRVLANPRNARFTSFAALLLERNNSPREVLKEYLSPLNFCRHWPSIKKRMRKNSWAQPRIDFWQAIYEKVLEKLHKKGISVRPIYPQIKQDKFYFDVGCKIKAARIKKGITQKDLAKKIGVPQQMVSRIERGKQNISLGTLRNIADKLGNKIKLQIHS